MYKGPINLLDLCITPPFAQFLCQAQILILKILHVFLWLKFSPSLNLNKIEHFSKVSLSYNEHLVYRKPFQSLKINYILNDKSRYFMQNH